MGNYNLTHLDELESEAIFIIREVVSSFETPALLFSGGKDSIVLTHLAKKAFYPARIPFPLIHVDTGHNFPETITFRDNLAEKLGVNLIVGSVQSAIDRGLVKEETSTTIERLVNDNISLVFCAITHDCNGQLLNTNADTIAAEIATAMASHFEVHLYYCFEKNGVLMDVNDPNSVIEHIHKEEVSLLQTKGIIADGMLPKLHNCFYALENGVTKVFVGQADMLQNELAPKTSLSL